MCSAWYSRPSRSASSVFASNPFLLADRVSQPGKASRPRPRPPPPPPTAATPGDEEAGPPSATAAPPVRDPMPASSRSAAKSYHHSHPLCAMRTRPPDTSSAARRVRARAPHRITPGMVNGQLRGARATARHGSGAVHGVTAACGGPAAATGPVVVVSMHVRMWESSLAHVTSLRVV